MFSRNSKNKKPVLNLTQVNIFSKFKVLEKIMLKELGKMTS